MKFNLNAESSETLTPAEVKEMFETIAEYFAGVNKRLDAIDKTAGS